MEHGNDENKISLVEHTTPFDYASEQALPNLRM